MKQVMKWVQVLQAHGGLSGLSPCDSELISFLRIRVLQNLQTKDVKKAHTLCVYMI